MNEKINKGKFKKLSFQDRIIHSALSFRAQPQFKSRKNEFQI